jgi:hypothetical protein
MKCRPPALLLGAGLALTMTVAERQVVYAQDAPAQVATAAPDADHPTPEEKMRRRMPHPVKVGSLIGLRVLDDDDNTIGFVRQVVRTPNGKIMLVVNHGRLFGWGGREVGVPIEAVAIFGRQLASLDVQPGEYAALPTWSAGNGNPIAVDQTILIGLTKR